MMASVGASEGTEVTVEVRVLGPLELAGPEGVVAVPARKQQRLLAALVIDAGSARSVDALIESVWDERPPASARKLLQVYVSQLRKVLPPPAAIRTHGAGYVLELPGDALDSDRFERLLREGQEALAAGNAELALSRFMRALDLWRGEAYGVLAYAAFAREEAERLAELRAVCLEERFEAELALGRAADVLPDLRAFAALHPSRERTRALEMLALYRSGRQSDALEVYAATRAHLRDELGLDPGPALRELQGRILRHDAALATPLAAGSQPWRVPAAPNRLVGRARELDEVNALLLRDDVRLLVLSGAGGSGKTRLALEAAHAAERSFANGAAFIGLAALRDPGLVAETIARSLGVHESAGRRPLETLVEALRDREVLLCVDNVEHLREAAPLFVELLALVPRLTLLVTSRVVLHVSGEHVYPVEPLGEADAMVLFEERAQQAGRPAADAASAGTVEEIVRRLDGLPLALELAAGRMRSLGPRELLARLEPRLPLLTGGQRDLPARQQTLQATLDWSNDLLSSDEQRLLARLSVFAGGCTLEAAVDVADATIDTLRALVESNLVRHDDGRYSMLETVREYAAVRLERLADDDATARRHAEFFLTVVERVEPELESEHQQGPLDLLEGELPNLRVALSFAVRSGAAELGIRLAGALRPFWSKRGHLTEGRAWLSAFLAADDSRSPARMKALFAAGLLATHQADWAETTRLCTACHELGLELGDARFAAISLLPLGRAALATGDPGRAGLLFAEASDRARANGDTATLAMARLNLGYLALSGGDHRRAEAELGAARAGFAELRDDHGAARALAGLGSVAIHAGRMDDAVEHLRTSLGLERLAPDEENAAWPLQLLGIAEANGRPAHAATLLGAAEALRESLELPLYGDERALHDRALTRLEASLDAEALQAAWTAGRALPLAEAIEHALADR
jgi:predicted ATPase/DNA-binding SARP family transcriptional activator